MNIPFGESTVTLYKRTETVTSGKTHVSYARSTLNNCSWRATSKMNRVDGTIALHDGITCRVPAGQTRPNVGDVLVFGNCTTAISSAAEIAALIEARREHGGAFVVQSVSDNIHDGTPMPHYKATGGF